MNTTCSNTANITTPPTAGSNQSLGHMRVNISSSPSHDHTAPLSSSPNRAALEQIPHPCHGQPLDQPPLLSNTRSPPYGGALRAATPQTHTQQQQQQQQHQQQGAQQNPHLSHPFQASTGAMLEQPRASDTTPQEQMVQQKQVDMAQSKLSSGSQSMQPQQQLISLRLDQTIACTGTSMKTSENQQISTDPISMGDMDQAEDAGGPVNRWPRQETLALLKIRADMDASFRDSSVKRPLWDEVSRKLGELGYHRSAKKCKEKFENVNKYYKRTKEGKVGRQDGKNYRFFSQLEALSTNHHHYNNNNNNNGIMNNDNNNKNTSINDNTKNNNPLMISPLSNFSSLTTPCSMLISSPIASTSDPITKFPAAAAPSDHSFPAVIAAPPSDHSGRPAEMLLFANSAVPSSLPAPLLSFDPIVFRSSIPAGNACDIPQFSSPSSCDEDDADGDEEEEEGEEEEDDNDDDDETEDGNPGNNMANLSDLPSNPAINTVSKKRKRKTSTSTLMAFFEKLMKRVVEKQEQMQQKLLQTLERRENDRMIREEAWRRQEMARLSKESELRAQERSSAAVRDAALMAFLQKATGQQSLDLPAMAASTSMAIAAQPVQFAPPPQLHQETAIQQYDDQGDPSDPNSRRWLKPEVLALIDLHSSLQARFTEAGPKVHLWEEIANGMAKLGFSSRTARRCKEKWENINKYFKRAKESSKKRPENAKACPYFHELDALYRKGLLGSSNANQLPNYKLNAINDPAQRRSDGNDAARPQPSSKSIVMGEGRADIIASAGVGAHPPCLPPDSALPNLDETTALINSVNASGGGDEFNDSVMSDVGIRNMDDSNGRLQNHGSSVPLSSTDAIFHSAAMSTSLSEHNPAIRGANLPELVLSSQQQPAAIMDLYQHEKMNESELGTGIEGALQESQAQSGKQESKPAVLAP